MNRITRKIKQTKDLLDTYLKEGKLTEAQAATVIKELDMGLTEYVKFQKITSRAVTKGLLTREEGATVHSLLGAFPSTFNNQPIEVKMTLTKLLEELLEGLKQA
jgi:polyhydroxyalkanoate synthesis regulator phasin